MVDAPFVCELVETADDIGRDLSTQFCRIEVSALQSQVVFKNYIICFSISPGSKGLGAVFTLHSWEQLLWACEAPQSHCDRNCHFDSPTDGGFKVKGHLFIQAGIWAEREGLCVNDQSVLFVNFLQSDKCVTKRIDQGKFFDFTLGACLSEEIRELADPWQGCGEVLGVDVFPAEGIPSSEAVG